MVDTLRETVAARYELANRFYRLKANILNKKKLAYHERNVEVGQVGGAHSFEKGVALVKKVFKI